MSEEEKKFVKACFDFLDSLALTFKAIGKELEELKERVEKLEKKG